MAGRIIKTEKQIIPVQILQANVGGTTTYTIQHITTEQLQDVEEIDATNEVHTIIGDDDDGDVEEVVYHQSESDKHVTVIQYEGDDDDDEHHEEQQQNYDQDDQEQQQLQQHEQEQHEYEIITGIDNEFSIVPQTSRGGGNKTKSFYCPNCGNCYSAAGSLKLHIRACLRQKESEAKALEARKCNICGKIYNSISYLKEHILRHSGNAPKKCPKCYRKFIDYDKLEAHIKSHQTELHIYDIDGNPGEKKIIKEYNCSFCQKKFQVVFDSRHTKRRYACDECREKFTKEENLKLHKESLEEKKEFRCERCGRKFVFEGFLQRHAPTCDGTIKRKRDRVF